MHLPKNKSVLKIGPYDFKIHYTDAMSTLGTGEVEWGRMILDPPRIHLQVVKPGSEDQQKETLIHEILHAVLEVGRGSHFLKEKDCDEEQFIRMVSPYLYQAIRDNKQVFGD